MRDQAKLRIDRYRSTYSKEELPARAGLSLFVSLFLAIVILAAPAASPAGVSVSVTIGPPALPVYVQPLIPGPGFIWVPGYWAWDPGFGYYWVPGVWVPAPFVGALWTPGYWAWSDGLYIWREGYWGPVVGFYGGINYGFGYTGSGYYGGYWSGGRYYYNRTVNNINVTNITTVYSKPVVNVRPRGASFNGGRGGTTARPTSEQLAAARQQRSPLTSEQKHHMQLARSDPKQRATENHGRPAIAATMKPGAFTGHGVVSASRASAPYKAPEGRQAAPHERMRTSRPDATMQPPTTRSERMEPRTSRRESERVTPGTSRRSPERMSTGTSRQERARTAPGTQRREPVRMAPGTPGQEHERSFNEPRPQRQRPKPTKPSPQKENNMGERREIR